jgi:hypothetical protein
MIVVELQLATIKFCITFEDVGLGSKFKAAFENGNLGASVRQVVNVKILGHGEYCILIDNNAICAGLTAKEAVFQLTLIFGTALRDDITETFCTLHASSVLIGERAVSLLGASGAGKSTLALLLAQYGCYIGDEYACLDLENGLLRHEYYPIQLKEGSRYLFPLLPFDDALALRGDSSVNSYLIPLNSVEHDELAYCHGRRLGALIFPQFNEQCTKTTISRLSIAELPSVLLVSAKNRETPQALFCRFVRFIALNSITVISIEFRCGIDAASELANYLKD